MATDFMNARVRLVHHVQQLERLESDRQAAALEVTEAFEQAKNDGYDTTTLRVVLKLRKMTPEQRRERRALEAIYMAALGMLEGDPLTDEARRRLDGQPEQPPQPVAEPETPVAGHDVTTAVLVAKAQPEQPPLLPPKDPAEARQEGADAAAAGKRIYDNPFPGGDLCRAAWDEGWCAQSRSHGMETPTAFQRRAAKPEKPEKKDGDDVSDDAKKGAA